MRSTLTQRLRLLALTPKAGRCNAALFFSTQPDAKANNSNDNSLPTFKYPKSQDLFERITAQCTKEDIQRLCEEVNTILGRPTRKRNKFAWIGGGGIGGRGRPVGMSASAAEQGESAAQEEAKKTVFDLKLTGFDAKAKIKVIKEVRSIIAGLGLKEAKEMVESAPQVIQKDLKPEQAEELKQKLEDVGAEIELV